jgi:uncharacterized protein
MTKEEIVQTFQLFITEKCNLNCRYCYEGSDKGKQTISLNIAKDALDRHIPHIPECDYIIIDLIGGEPLIEYDLIRELFDFTEERRAIWNREFVLFATTNGTLLTDEMKSWFYKNREKVILGLSLDGTRKAHNLNRSNSYDLIEPHFSFFRETWPEQPVKMTINPDVLDQIFDGVLNIYSNGLTCTANVVFEDVWNTNKEENLRIFASELDRLVEFFGERPELDAPALILQLPITNLTNGVEENWKWCGAGTSMRCIYADGKIYDCHRFATIPKNSFKAKINEEAQYNPKCQSCVFLHACPTCDAYNTEVTGYPTFKTDFHCEFIKLQILATAKLEYRRLLYRFSKLYHQGEGLEELSNLMSTLESIIFVNQHMDLPNYANNLQISSDEIKTSNYAKLLEDSIIFK